MDLSEFKEILQTVYSKAVNSYHELQDIIVGDILNSILKDYDDESNIEINIKDKADKVVNYVTLGDSGQTNLNLTFSSSNIIADYNTIALPSSDYYNSGEIVTNQTH